MPEIGQYILILAWVVSTYVIYVGWSAGKNNNREMAVSAYRGVWTVFGLLTLASIILVYLLAVRDFRVDYVVRYTSAKLPVFYAIPAFWAGNAGSLLLWVWLLSAFAALALYRHRHTASRLIPYVAMVCMMIATFFITLMLFLFREETGANAWFTTNPLYSALQTLFDTDGQVRPIANPFFTTPYIPTEGKGLNPQLQNPGMMFHPPTLYLGYVGLAIPFAFAMAALLVRRVDNTWLIMTRRWTITAWFFLSIGNILGAWWAYVTLGWGGFWTWDPVENASFMPWLTATAFLHSVMIQEKRGMLKLWNMLLVIASFGLTIFGTFLTRSGVISSVHAFAQSPAFNITFLVFLATMTAWALWLVVSRLDLLESDNRLNSLFSREAAFLYNNLVLVGAAFVVLFGTMFPMLSEWLTGRKITVGPPWFNLVLSPLWLFLIILTGVGPVIAWRRTSKSNVTRNFTWPALVGVITAVALPLMGVTDGYAIAFSALCAFVVGTIVQEFWRGGRARARKSGQTPVMAVIPLLFRHPRRYGGYIVHLGIVMIVMGASISMIYQYEQDLTLRKGQSVKVKDYDITFSDFQTHDAGNKMVHAAVLHVVDDGVVLGEMRTVKEDYRVEQMRWTQPAINYSLKEDLYLTLASFAEDGSVVTVNAKINPMVDFLWLGGLVLIFGTVIAMWPDRRERRQVQQRRKQGHD